MPLSRRLTCGLLAPVIAVPLFAQTPTSPRAQSPALEPPDQLVRDVVYNELHDRERDSHWQYRSECTAATGSYVREQVETDRGPVYRIVAQNGQPLDAGQRLREDRRLDDYVRDPAQIARAARAHQQDEDRLGAAIALMPQALLFQYQGAPAADRVQLAFRPNPAFSPSGIEARIVHALAGTVTVNLRLKRMVEMHGEISDRVDFGFGLLGQVAKGGSFTVHRLQVSPTHWKTDLVDTHIHGKVLLLKTFGKVQRETRSDFHAVPGGTTPSAAVALLNHDGAAAEQAKLPPAPGQPGRPGATE